MAPVSAICNLRCTTFARLNDLDLARASAPGDPESPYRASQGLCAYFGEVETRMGLYGLFAGGG